jgi:hypothetical protein
MEKDAENYSNINLFSSKINICSNKPITTIQKFRCTLTNLNTADEVTRIDGIFFIFSSDNLPTGTSSSAKKKLIFC